MALLTRKDLCEKTGLQAKHITMYISRGKIVEEGGYFDDSHPQNASFIESRASDEPDSEPTARGESRSSQIGSSLNKVTVALKKAQTQKTLEQIEIEKLRKEQMQGKLISTDLVKQIFAQQFKNVTVSFLDIAEDLIRSFSNEDGVDKLRTTQRVKRLENNLNSAVEKSKEMTAHDMKILIDSQKK